MVCSHFTFLRRPSPISRHSCTIYLPVEIWRRVIDFIVVEGHSRTTLETLARCARVCHTFKNIAQLHLRFNFECGGGRVVAKGSEEMTQFMLRSVLGFDKVNKSLKLYSEDSNHLCFIFYSRHLPSSSSIFS